MSFQAAMSESEVFSSIMRRCIGASSIIYYISLMYKLQLIGLACLAVMAVFGLLVKRPKILNNKIAIVSILYIFLATVTAYFVGIKEGVYRSIQFAMLVFSMVGLVKFWELSTEVQQKDFVKNIILINIGIFIHLILYHLLIGKITTWKYLYDTKTVISIIVILLFTYITPIKNKMGVMGVFLTILIVGFLVLMSGERKSYLLMAILFTISTIPFRIKIMAGFISGVIVIFFILISPDNNYVKRQVLSSIGVIEQTSGLYDNYRHQDLVTISNLQDFSDLTRRFVNENAWRLFKENPILGLGSGGYQQWAYHAYGPDYYYSGVRMNVHGEINRIPVESGIIGILVSTYLVLLLGRACLGAEEIKSFKRNNSKGLFKLYLLIFIIIYCSFEAMDTLMLSMVLSFGLFVSREDYSRCFAKSV